MNRFLIEKSEEEIVIKDEAPRPRKPRAVFDRVSPAYIPGIRLGLELDKETEKFAIGLPRDVFKGIPVLVNCPRNDSDGAPELQSKLKRPRMSCPTLDHASEKAPVKRDDGDCNQQAYIELPGTMWHLLIVLKIGLEASFNGDALFLDQAEPDVLSGTLQVCGHGASVHAKTGA